MPVFIDPRDGFPYWGNPSPQKSSVLIGHDVNGLIADIGLNQVPGGSAEEQSLHFKQIPASKQARAEGASANNLEEIGKYGSDLFQKFMSPYEPRQP